MPAGPPHHRSLRPFRRGSHSPRGCCGDDDPKSSRARVIVALLAWPWPAQRWCPASRRTRRPSPGLVTGEVVPGIVRVIDDGAGHHLDARRDVVVGPDGSVWLRDGEQVFALGRPSLPPICSGPSRGGSLPLAPTALPGRGMRRTGARGSRCSMAPRGSTAAGRGARPRSAATRRGHRGSVRRSRSIPTARSGWWRASRTPRVGNVSRSSISVPTAGRPMPSVMACRRCRVARTAVMPARSWSGPTAVCG